MRAARRPPARRAGCSRRRRRRGSRRARRPRLRRRTARARRARARRASPPTARARRRPPPRAASRRAASTSNANTRAPACASFRASDPPTLPTPTTPTVRPSSSGDPVAAARPSCIARITVSAVTGDGSPRPPFSTERPTTQRVWRDIRSMSAVRRADVLGGDVRAAAARRRPRRRHAGARRGARSRPSSSITALPPAEIEPRRRGLERHRPREAKDVFERLRHAAGIGAQAHSAEGRAEHRRVHGDDQSEADLRVLADDHTLVLDSIRCRLHNGHVSLPYTPGMLLPSALRGVNEACP